jgi:hypothetical protein
MKTLLAVLAIIVALGPSTGEAQNRRPAVRRNSVQPQFRPQYIAVIRAPRSAKMDLGTRTQMTTGAINAYLKRNRLGGSASVLGYGWQGAIHVKTSRRGARSLGRLGWIQGVAKGTIMRRMNVPYLDRAVTLSYLGIGPKRPRPTAGQKTGTKTHAQ